jgi:soluble cytochrome b562
MDTLAAGIGHNNPPKEPTPFEIAEKAINDIYEETVLWLDGKAIDSQEMADGVGNLLTKIREAEKQADTARVAEKTALDEKVKEIQARYAPLIADTKAVKGKTVLAAQACKDALAPWLMLVKRRQDEEAKKARDIADALRKKAEDAIRNRETADLASHAKAEDLVAVAKKAEKVAAKAEAAKPQAGGTFGRSIALKTVFMPMMTDPAKAVQWAWSEHSGDMITYVQSLAEADVRLGKRDIDGFEIVSEQQAV